MKFIRSLYIDNRLYLLLLANAVVFVFAYFFPVLYAIGEIIAGGIIALVVTDMILLYSQRQGVTASRDLPEKFSNGDQNKVNIHVKNNYRFTIHSGVIDEIPAQFQIRDFYISTVSKSREEKVFSYSLRPLKRGEYRFGKLKIYASTILKIFSRRFVFCEPEMIPVYPSFLQMRKYELLAISDRLTEAGIKKIRSIGRNLEFDQIRKYNTDDDYRSINWKATARKGELMVNQYEQERSQQVFSLIDMGRVMKMPFEGMTLLDYAINASLVISNIAVLKHDKAGLVTFTNKINTFIQADRKKNQIPRILEILYNQETNFVESNYELLYITVKRNINQRSLLFLYTNFESMTSLQRQLSFLKLLTDYHLLVVIFFVNTEIQGLLNSEILTLEDVYIKTIAEKTVLEKRLIAKELNKNGIHCILTEPANLSVNTINKYLELKSLGLI
ncbi:MAG: DUF58 domain-containing protein [Bacteroidota bacterium]